MIDSSTIRSTSSYTAEKIDWQGKLALLEASKLVGLKKFISFSVLNASSNSSIPLMDLKLRNLSHTNPKKRAHQLMYTRK